MKATKFPMLGEKTYVGERGFVVTEQGFIRNEADVFVVTTQDILIATGLDQYYRPIDKNAPPPDQDNTDTQNPGNDDIFGDPNNN